MLYETVPTRVVCSQPSLKIRISKNKDGPLFSIPSIRACLVFVARYFLRDLQHDIELD